MMDKERSKEEVCPAGLRGHVVVRAILACNIKAPRTYLNQNVKTLGSSCISGVHTPLIFGQFWFLGRRAAPLRVEM